ncbi:hypothetical protein BW730_04145 [Tessaracoccus aquimaris]|uniref:Inner membrane protein YgaP-like transmembrane domain-containing protein n=1 Tax=Tessaracoccus aquimaris TaxID=1332264 RepID=A0A1Q2CL63_9ACTN|nr:YgaP-like transmembrane domain [Tessaracoccus aquimaris]AQP46839.1 hypothetical protein BW730_04145 [Tessaracoccus aquimaris]
MRFAQFMSSTAGRALRIVAGVALLAAGITILVAGGSIALGVVLLAVGALFTVVGALNVCLLAPIFGASFDGRKVAGS